MNNLIYANMTNRLVNSSTSVKSRVFTLLLVLLPIINQIKILDYGFLEFFSVAAMLIVLLRSHFRLKVSGFFLFYIYMTLSAFISTIVYGESMVTAVFSAARIIVIYVGIFEGAKELFDIKYAKQWFVRIALALSVLLFFQFAMYYLFGRQIYLIPDGLTLNYGGGMDSSILIQRNMRSVLGGYIFRPSSAFIEPSYFAYYSSPALIVLLFGKNLDRKSLYKALVISLASILTTSTISLVSVVFTWLLFVLFGRNSLSRGQRQSITAFIVVLFVAIVIVLNQSAVQFSLSRKMTQMLDLGESSSSSMRLTRGWEYFGYMNPFLRIIGCGFGHLADYFDFSGMGSKMSYSINLTSYMNSFTGVLCSLGFVGLLLFFHGLIPIIRSKVPIKRFMAVLLIILMLAGAVMDLGFYYLIIAFMLSEQDVVEKEEGLYEY